jgi:beta-lactamase class A
MTRQSLARECLRYSVPVPAEAIQTLFERAGCAGHLCVQSLDGTREVAVEADELVSPASVIKVPIAMVAQVQFEEGALDPRERVTMPGDDPVPGPVNFSLYQDDVQASLRDLVVSMLTISDNVATDALVDRLGIDTINFYLRRLGLANTVMTSNLRTMIDAIGRDAGFADWAAMMSGTAQLKDQAETDRVDALVLAGAVLDPARGFRTTPRDMALLLRLIWTDKVGPPKACDRIRQIMRRQLTRNRLASAFAPPVRVAAKSGSLIGVLRNEVGVIEYPDGDKYVAAVFTQTSFGCDERPVNAAIGEAAAVAVEHLRRG